MNAGNSIYVFDITGRLVIGFSSEEKFRQSDFYSKWFASYQHLRYSTNAKQHCIFGTLFITRIKNFKVNYFANNHNPLRVNLTFNYAYNNRLPIILRESNFKKVYKVKGFWKKDGTYHPYRSYYFSIPPTAELYSETLLSVGMLHNYFLKTLNSKP